MPLDKPMSVAEAKAKVLNAMCWEQFKPNVDNLISAVRSDERTKVLARFKALAKGLTDYRPSSISCNDEHMKGRQFAYIDAGQRLLHAIEESEKQP